MPGQARDPRHSGTLLLQHRQRGRRWIRPSVRRWDDVGVEYRGREQLRRLALGVATHLPGARHLASEPLISLSGATARSVSQLTAFLSRPERIYIVLQGLYEDDLVKVDGEWFFAHRRARVENPEILARGAIGEYYRPLVSFLTQR